MKKIKLLLISTLLFSISANSQITKNYWMMGGTGNFTNYKSTIQNNNTEIVQTGNAFQFSPDIGYFVIDNLALGAVVILSYSNPSGENNNSYGYGISPFVRYYFRKPEKMINFFLQTSYGFSEGKSESGGSNRSSGYNLKGGSAIFLNSSVALELSIDYDSSKSNYDAKYNNFIIGIGFQIYLEKK
jgi:hypothetical protein